MFNKRNVLSTFQCIWILLEHFQAIFHFKIKALRYYWLLSGICINSTSECITELCNCKNMDNNYVLCPLSVFIRFSIYTDGYSSQSTRIVKTPTESLASYYCNIAGIWWSRANNAVEIKKKIFLAATRRDGGKEQNSKAIQMTVCKICQKYQADKDNSCNKEEGRVPCNL